jgi:hypothetical protein
MKTPPAPSHATLPRPAVLRTARAAALGLVALVALVALACSASAFGRVFISPVKSSAGRFIGVVVDFVKTARFGDKRIAVELRYRGVDLDLPGRKVVKDSQGRPDGYSACVAMPDTGRLTILARTGEVSTGARVRVLARERIAAGNTVGCTGGIIDDAIWPASAATTPDPTADGGAADGAADGAGQGG